MQANDDILLLAKILPNICLFDNMRRDDIVRILNLMSKSTYQPGHYIFREGDKGATLYVLASGSAEVRKSVGRNKMATLAVLNPGDTFGEIALVRDHTRTASVYVCEPCMVLGMETNSLWQVPELAAKLYLNVARLLADRLVIANELLFAR